MKIATVISMFLSVTLLTACNPGPVEEPTADDVRVEEGLPVLEEDVQPTQAERFEIFREGFTRFELPITCETFNTIDMLELPAADLLEEFVVVDQEEGNRLPTEIDSSWWNSDDISASFRLLGQTSKGGLVFLFYRFNWDDGYSEYSGIMMMRYQLDGTFLGLHDFCGSDVIERPGMIMDNTMAGLLSEDLLFTHTFQHISEENTGEEPGEQEYVGSIEVLQFEADGSTTEVSFEDFEDDAALELFGR